jgi:hypothetical protein
MRAVAAATRDGFATGFLARLREAAARAEAFRFAVELFRFVDRFRTVVRVAKT